MKKRYVICAAIFAACVCLALVALALLPPSGVTKANFDLIEEGMREEEVIAIFGKQADVLPMITHRDRLFASPKFKGWTAPDGSFASIGFTGKIVSAKRW